MVNLLNYDFDLVQGYVTEFVQAVMPGQEFVFSCIYASGTFPDSRRIFALVVGEQEFALKMDRDSPETGRLQHEFAILKRLWDHFAEIPQQRVVRPVYMSPGGAFMVTDLLDYPTARQALERVGADDQRFVQVFRRAGGWLHHLHNAQPKERIEFDPDWMFQQIEELLQGDNQAQPEHYEGHILAMRREGDALRGRSDIGGFAHGDFHTQNLLLGKGEVIGLDFADTTTKLCLYDVVDFLREDARYDARADQLDRSGIRRTTKDMFFKLYRQPIDHEVMDYCIRSGLLLEFIGISRERYQNTQYSKLSFQRLQTRLAAAFGGA